MEPRNLPADMPPSRPWMAPNIAMVMAMLFGSLAFIFWPFQEPRGAQVMVPGWPGGALEIGPWLKAHPLPPDKAAYLVELTLTSRSSVAIVQLRDSEKYHLHQRHDLVVSVLRGSGTMRLGGERQRIGPGDVVAIPAGIPHAFIKRDEKGAPAVALVVFSPPFDGKDSVQVEEKGAPQ